MVVSYGLSAISSPCDLEPVSDKLLMDITVTLDNLRQCAQYFWEQVPEEERLFAFYGEMGVGKTSFIAALCAAKGVTGHVSSPTFSLINEYTYKEKDRVKRIFHIDLYRLKNEEEAVNAGIEDCLYSGYICFVEWPEKIPSLLPAHRVDICMHPVNKHTRLLKIDFHR